MARISRPDGVELEWMARGDGPLVVLVSYWSFHPSVFEPITRELERDHRVVRYDDRGAGDSTRQGPYDIETAADDLEAVVEALGGGAVAIANGDGTNRAARVAVRRPDLIEALICQGGPPIGRASYAGSEALAASDSVVEALLSMVETDYRAALRSTVGAANEQMTDDEVRERVASQADYVPQDVALARLRAWIDDDPFEYSKALGERLWVLYSDRLGGGWFPRPREVMGRLREVLPQAQWEEIEDGLVSRPDLTAGVVRRVTAAAAARDRAVR